MLRGFDLFYRYTGCFYPQNCMMTLLSSGPLPLVSFSFPTLIHMIPNVTSSSTSGGRIPSFKNTILLSWEFFCYDSLGFWVILLIWEETIWIDFILNLKDKML